MKRIVACLLVLIVAVIPAYAHASREDTCADLAAYFTLVDKTMSSEMAELIRQPGFREAFESANAASERDGSGFLALTSEQQEAIIAFMRMPEEALAGVGDAEIPASARDLHDSAVTYWGLTADMMQAISEESPSAAMPFFEEVDAAARDNAIARRDLIAACPEEVANWSEASGALHTSADGTPEADVFAMWDAQTTANMDGVGYVFLFFAPDDGASDT